MSKKGPPDPHDKKQDQESQEEEPLYDDSLIEIDTDEPETASYLAAKKSLKEPPPTLDALLMDKEEKIEDLLAKFIKMSKRTIMPNKDSYPLAKQFEKLSSGILDFNRFENADDPHIKAKKEMRGLIRSMKSDDPNVRPKRSAVTEKLLNIQNDLYKKLYEDLMVLEENKAKKDKLIIKEIMIKMVSYGNDQVEEKRINEAKVGIAAYNHAKNKGETQVTLNIADAKKENREEETPADIPMPSTEELKVFIAESREERKLLLKNVLKDVPFEKSEKDNKEIDKINIDRAKNALKQYNDKELTAWQQKASENRTFIFIPLKTSDSNSELITLINEIRAQQSPRPPLLFRDPRSESNDAKSKEPEQTISPDSPPGSPHPKG